MPRSFYLSSSRRSLAQQPNLFQRGRSTSCSFTHRLSSGFIPTEKMCRSPPQSSSTAHSSAHLHRSALGRNRNAAGLCTGWKPLLLIIPLRLGINHINPVYIDAFKVSFFFFQWVACYCQISSSIHKISKQINYNFLFSPFEFLGML